MVDPNRPDFPNRPAFFQFIAKNPPKPPKTIKKNFPQKPPKLIVNNPKNPQKAPKTPN
jgi:hypothetical protein